MSHAWAVILAILLTTTTQGALAQRTATLTPHLTPHLAQQLVVEVRPTILNSDTVEEALPLSAGTIVGFARDTLFVVCATHAIANASGLTIRRQHAGERLPAARRLQIEPIDITVLAVPIAPGTAISNLPRFVTRRDSLYPWDEDVFALGCPEGKCWGAAERGRVSTPDNQWHVRFRTYFLRPGMSGGPLVDRDGALIGIVVKDEMSAEGRAVSWRTIVEVLRMNGIPVNLLEARGYRMRVFTTRLFISAYPRAGVNSDGQRLQRGWRAELTYRISPNAEVVAGLNRISFAAAPYRDQDADWDEAYAHLYGFSGFRLTTPVKWWSIGHRLPDVASVGFDILLPFNHESGVVSLVPSDSVNLQRGVPVYVRSRVTSQVGIGFAYRASYRIALSEGTAVVIAPSLYMVNFEHLNSSPARGFLEVGGEVRLGR